MSDVTIKKGKDMLGVIVYGTEYLVDYDFFKDSLDKYVDAEDRILICHMQKKVKTNLSQDILKRVDLKNAT